MAVLEVIQKAFAFLKKTASYALYRELSKENERLQKDVEQLNQIILDDKNMHYDPDKQAFFHNKEDGITDGPYCPVCWQRDRKKVFLKDFGVLRYKCSVCQSVSEDVRYRSYITAKERENSPRII